jgi:serine/threonine protein phosphatase 1
MYSYLKTESLMPEIMHPFPLRDKSPQSFHIPDGVRVYAIGDMHGRVDLLRKLHDMIRIDVQETRFDAPPVHPVVVYLGDYLDRGDFCRELIDLLLDDPLEDITAFHLRGNHEQKVLEFLVDTEIGSDWIFWGGAATLRSYGADIEDPRFGRLGWDWLQEEFRQRLPARHLAFLNKTLSSHTIGDYFFVHAGVKPDVPLSEQTSKDLLWIRGEFLDSQQDFGKKIVHGHTIVDDVEVHPNRIAVDTGAWRTNKLSCLILERDHLHLLQT